MTRRSSDPIRHILCSVDGTDVACRAANLATHLATALKADLTYLAVCTEGSTDAAIETYKRTEGLQGEYFHLFAHDAEECLDIAFRAAINAGLHQTRRLVRTGSVAKTILAVATETDTDMLVLGHRKARRLHKAVFGSVADSVADNGNFLVVLIG